MKARWRHTVTVPTLPQPDIIVASAKAKLVQLAHERAVRDRPPAVDHSFGGSLLPALCEIRDATISALESMGIPYREGLRLALTAVGRREAEAASTEARHADLARRAASIQESHRAARDRVKAEHPEQEFPRWAAKLFVLGFFLLVGAMVEGLLAAPVGTAMGLPGNQILLVQVALGSILTLGSVLAGWLVGCWRHGSDNHKLTAGVGAGLLIATLIALQAWLAPIRGAVVAGNMELIQNLAAHGHIKVTIVSAGVATGFFLTLGLVIVTLGVMEGYLLYDPSTSAYRRASRALARLRRRVHRSLTALAARASDCTVNAAAYEQYRAMWVSAARALRADGEAAMSVYVGEVAAHANEDIRAALYEARRPPIPLPHWVTGYDAEEPSRLRAVS